MLYWLDMRWQELKDVFGVTPRRTPQMSKSCGPVDIKSRHSYWTRMTIMAWVTHPIARWSLNSPQAGSPPAEYMSRCNTKSSKLKIQPCRSSSSNLIC